MTPSARGLGLLALLPLLLAHAASSAGQTLLWSEDFENGCATGCLAEGYVGGSGAWTVEDVSAPGASANTWYVSCAENGNAEDACGSGCAGDATLHVGNVASSPGAFLFCPAGDCGAAYDASGASVVSDKRAQSPSIDLSGRSGLVLSFLFLAAGEPCDDATSLEISTNGGASWLSLRDCLTSDNAGCGGQGRWTRFEVDLPLEAEDNPDVRIAFHWRNDGDFRGSDPSFAVDDLRVEVGDDPCDPDRPLGVDLWDELRVGKESGEVDLDWSLAGPVAAPATHWHVHRSNDPSLPRPDGWELLGADAPPVRTELLADPVLRDGSNWFYDVRAADDCESVGN